MNWIPIVVAMIVFVTGSIGLGYLGGFWARRRKWPGWFAGLTALVIACLWPVIAVVFVSYTGSRYAAQHPGEVNDAPAMVMTSVLHVSPLIFLFGLSFAVLGLSIARRSGSNGHADD
jgi:hypothetical protein